MPSRAVAVIRGSTGINGTVWFSQDKDDEPVTIKGDITGLKPGEHNVHIAELGYPNDGISSASTWLSKMSTSPEMKDAFANIANLKAQNDGSIHFEMKDKDIHLNGRESIIGRNIVVDNEKIDENLTEAQNITRGRSATGVIAVAERVEDDE